jgi:hypothetical protein
MFPRQTKQMDTVFIKGFFRRAMRVGRREADC